MKLISCQCIWKDDAHNAFTDLCRYQDRFLISFRSASTHHSSDGKILILQSPDGEHWSLLATIQQANTDLRDPKFTLRPDGKLSLNCMAVGYQGDKAVSGQSTLFLSDDGEHWGEAHPIGDEGLWLWRTTWHEETCYSFGYYGTAEDKFIRLYRSNDGLNFETWIERAYSQGFSNEYDMVFQDNGSAIVLLRRDGKTDNTAVLGTSSADLKEWQWQELNIRIGGPALLQLPNGELIAAIRTYSEDNAATELQQLDLQAKCLRPRLVLPSGGDTSYAGMLYHQERLCVGYYSSHEGSTAIYFAQVEC